MGEESASGSGAGVGAPAPRRKRRSRVAKLVVAGGVVTLAVSQDARNRLLDLLFGPEEEFEYESETEPAAFGLGPRDPRPAPAEPPRDRDDGEDPDERADRERVAELEGLESAITGEGVAAGPARFGHAAPATGQTAPPDTGARGGASPAAEEPRATFTPLHPSYEPPPAPSLRRFEPAPATDPARRPEPRDRPGFGYEPPASGEIASTAAAGGWGGARTAATPPSETLEPAGGRFEWEMPSAADEPEVAVPPRADEPPALERCAPDVAGHPEAQAGARPFELESLAASEGQAGASGATDSGRAARAQAGASGATESESGPATESEASTGPTREPGPEPAAQAPTASEPGRPAGGGEAAPRRSGWWLPRRRQRSDGPAERPRWD